ncbi:ankyrin repeat-containing domain protein [Pyronema domesticum]|uniref:Similar to Ankyrin repeat domain-containing protein 36B acc. no. Q8N2N9 n=1 Tax=Pyronema omphalodes (strain CBS 100304) TaxID=1076935 RepID=U4KUD9_PYROM|nr:ankyrin repeat-containing domain protein [Pyronema domesticum]CCX04622.1 Similar to Ankyrin repeat domain-containing protein 36B; acc. no. Q8N2N9 [Pyronema omphalodes CBS 100304]
MEIVRLLLKRKEVKVNDIPNATNEGMPLILSMARYSKEESMRLLLERSDIDVNARHYIDQSTALINAIQCGQENIVRILLERKDIDIHARDCYGRTALSMAHERGHYSIVDILKSRIQYEKAGIDTDSRKNLPLPSSSPTVPEEIDATEGQASQGQRKTKRRKNSWPGTERVI